MSPPYVTQRSTAGHRKAGEPLQRTITCLSYKQHPVIVFSVFVTRLLDKLTQTISFFNWTQPISDSQTLFVICHTKEHIGCCRSVKVDKKPELHLTRVFVKAVNKPSTALHSATHLSLSPTASGTSLFMTLTYSLDLFRNIVRLSAPLSILTAQKLVYSIFLYHYIVLW